VDLDVRERAEESLRALRSRLSSLERDVKGRARVVDGRGNVRCTTLVLQGNLCRP